MKPAVLLLFTLLVSFFAATVSHAAAAAFLVANGRPRAEIIIAEQPSRTQRLAAQELRSTVEKITGARLPVVTSPLPEAIRMCHALVGPERLLFASDHPGVEPRVILDAFVAAKLPAAAVEKVCSSNARRLFNL